MQRRSHAHVPIARPLAVAILLALGGCASVAPPVEAPPPAPLHLLSAGALELPSECQPADGTVYRMNFVVETDGRVTGARAESGDGCVQDALRSWVSSFRYAPVRTAMPAVLDWLEVTASRGG
jgi:hypothetical protein